MSAGVEEAHILHVALPFKRRFKHALSLRSQSDSIFLKLYLVDKTVGYGESLPREYVTGETPQSVIEELKEIIRRNFLGFTINSYKEVPSFIDSLNIKGSAARCALELALLDAYGRYFKNPLSSIIGRKRQNPVIYSGVIQAGSIPNVIMTSLAFKILDLRFIKVKVGVGDDIKRLKIIRNILGKGADIRVDANCAWEPAEAIEKIISMRPYNISAIEQPVRADDYQGLKRVTDSVAEDIIADESICTIDDAQKLAGIKACNMFNIRISKCGGIFNSLKIADIAQNSGIAVQLGCQVGESGLLSAAGWHFANAKEKLSFCEGSYGRFLLKEDITKEDMTIRRGGMIGPIDGPGLGVNILDEILDRYVVSKDIIR